MPRDIARGISSVKRFVRQHSIQGVYGTLIELIECTPRLHTAIEVPAWLAEHLPIALCAAWCAVWCDTACCAR